LSNLAERDKDILGSVARSCFLRSEFSDKALSWIISKQRSFIMTQIGLQPGLFTSFGTKIAVSEALNAMLI
jgi:hypothetical protein